MRPSLLDWPSRCGSGGGRSSSPRRRRSGSACGWKSRSSAPSVDTISGGSAICFRRWTTRACWCRSSRPGRHAGVKPMVLNRDGFQPREYLLSALGQAATICPRIEAEPEVGGTWRLYGRLPRRARVPFGARSGARAGGLRRVSSVVVVAQGREAAAGGTGGRQAPNPR